MATQELFNSSEAAQTKCIEMGSGCNGVVQGGDGIATLRTGTEFFTTPAHKNFQAWLKKCETTTTTTTTTTTSTTTSTTDKTTTQAPTTKKITTVDNKTTATPVKTTMVTTCDTFSEHQGFTLKGSRLRGGTSLDAAKGYCANSRKCKGIVYDNRVGYTPWDSNDLVKSTHSSRQLAYVKKCTSKSVVVTTAPPTTTTKSKPKIVWTCTMGSSIGKGFMFKGRSIARYRIKDQAFASCKKTRKCKAVAMDRRRWYVLMPTSIKYKSSLGNRASEAFVKKCTSSTVVPTTPPPPTTARPGVTFTFYPKAGPKSVLDAGKYCKSKGQRLAVPATAAQRSQLNQVVGTGGYFVHIGIYDWKKEGQFFAYSNNPIQYNWQTGNPKKSRALNCVSQMTNKAKYSSNREKWFNVSCKKKLGLVACMSTGGNASQGVKQVKTTASVATNIVWCPTMNDPSTRCGREANNKVGSLRPTNVPGSSSVQTRFRRVRRSRRDDSNEIVMFDIIISSIVDANQSEDDFMTALKEEMDEAVEENENATGVQIAPIEVETIDEDEAEQALNEDIQLAPLDYLLEYVSNIQEIGEENFEVVKFGDRVSSWAYRIQLRLQEWHQYWSCAPSTYNAADPSYEPSSDICADYAAQFDSMEKWIQTNLPKCEGKSKDVSQDAILEGIRKLVNKQCSKKLAKDIKNRN